MNSQTNTIRTNQNNDEGFMYALLAAFSVGASLSAASLASAELPTLLAGHGPRATDHSVLRSAAYGQHRSVRSSTGDRPKLLTRRP